LDDCRGIASGDKQRSREAEPSVINVNFIAKIEPETKLIIWTRQAGGRRAVSHWDESGNQLASAPERSSRG
jgi:hypothetical protein